MRHSFAFITFIVEITVYENIGAGFFAVVNCQFISVDGETIRLRLIIFIKYQIKHIIPIFEFAT